MLEEPFPKYRGSLIGDGSLKNQIESWRTYKESLFFCVLGILYSWFKTNIFQFMAQKGRYNKEHATIIKI